MELGDQFVVTDRLPDVVPVQLPDVCARAGSVNRANTARAKKTVQKICPEEKDREFFIFWGVGILRHLLGKGERKRSCITRLNKAGGAGGDDVHRGARALRGG